MKLLSSASILASLVSLWVCVSSSLDTICCWLLSSIFLNSSIWLFIKAAMSMAPPLLFLRELSPWVASDLLASGTAAGLGFDAAGFSEVLVVFLSTLF
ncbi:hypothetical protein H8356DRAFT_927187 [Neocallimastix lanati (nom. inval.)]|nr:hypothetical protein H8356DRAFT_927187 [Neocallimastix sp. JGI-2020a]